MQRLDLNLLVVFAALMAEQNVSRAAEKLRMSQPGVSNALTRLRRQTQDMLFVRTRHGVEPTDRAHLLFAEIHEGLSTIQRALDSRPAFDAAKEARRFRIIVSDLGEVVHLPVLLRQFSKVAPGVSISVVQLPRDRYGDALASGEADLAIGENHQLSTNIYRQRLFQDEQVCLVRVNHPRIKRAVTMDQFTAEEHVVVAPPGIKGAAYNKMLSHIQLKRNVLAQVASHLAAPVIVRDTNAIAVVPSLLLKLLPVKGVKAISLPFDAGRLTVNQYWHIRAHRDVANVWLRAQVAESLKKFDID
jgi:DNA-binding transcriptional LysR family regulator